jgi:hypothetical protein
VERWLGYQALYHTRGFTARYSDDFEELPFYMEDLSRIVERLVLVSSPWQAWFMSVPHVYTWEDPRRTGKWFALFCIIWYTNQSWDLCTLSLYILSFGTNIILVLLSQSDIL